MKRFLGTLLVLFTLSGVSQAATFYLNPASGSDSNNGSQGSPWKTIFKVKTTVNAGDTVNILGGSYTQAQIAGEGGTPSWTTSQRLGTANNPITIQANPGDTVIIDGGFSSYFQRFFSNVTSYNGHYVVVKNLILQNYDAAIIGVSGNAGNQTAHHVAIVGCTLRNVAEHQSAALATFNAHHVIFKDNHLNNIGDKNLTGGDNLPYNEHGFYISDQSQFIVLDHNYTELVSGHAVHAFNSHGTANTSKNVSMRRNTWVNSRASGTIIAGDTIQNFYVFNNTQYTDNPVWSVWDANPALYGLTFHNGGSYSNIQIKNNLVYGSYQTGTQTGAFTQDSSGDFTNLFLDYNWWTNIANSNNVMAWNNTAYSFSGFVSAIGRETHGKTGNPNFTNIGARDFTLQSTSGAIDAGTSLTTASGAGSASTSLTVADAGYFHDGYGLGVPGDTIRIGSTSVVVTGVNYSTNVITLGSPATWSNGAPVSLDYSGANPDMGANEFVAAPSSPKTYYVSAGGHGDTPSDSNTCTQATQITTPKLTIPGGIGCMAAKDTLYIRGGTYAQRIDSQAQTIPGGDSFAAPTLIAQYQNETVTLNPTGADPIIRLDTSVNQYIIISGLTLSGGGTAQRAIIIQGPAGFIRLQNVVAQNTTSSTVYMTASSNNEIIGNTILTTPLICIYMDGNSQNNLIQNNTISGCTVAGIDVDGLAGPSTISGNWVKDPPGGSTGASILLEGAGGDLVMNNLITNGYGGIYALDAPNELIYNNTLYTHSNFGIKVDAAATGASVKNNIVYLSQGITNNGGATVSNNLTTDPSFVNAASNNFHLGDTSAAREAGVTLAEVPTDKDGNARPQGLAYEIGAYEETPVSLPTNPPKPFTLRFSR